MKKGLFIGMAMILVIGYVYFFEFSSAKKELVKEIKRSQIADSRGLEKITIKMAGQDPIVLINQGVWWIKRPIKYPAEPGIIEQNLTVMRQILSDSHFPFKEDRYGFSKPQGILKLSYESGEKKKLILGSVKAPGNKLYILEKKSQTVFVVNNVWGQFFYKNLQEYMVKDFYIKYRDINRAQFKGRQDQGWEVLRADKLWVFTEKTKTSSPFKSPIGGLFGALREIKVSDVDFESKDLDIFYTLSLWLKGGEKFEIGFNKEKTRVSLPHLKVIAKVDPSSVRYFLNEVRKAAKSGDKNKVSNKN